MDLYQLKQMEPIFGSWYIDREIGSGSFGKVYVIHKDDAGFRFEAALKVISIPKDKNDIDELDSQGFDHAAKVKYFDNITAGIMEEIRIMNTLRGFTNIVCFEDYQMIPHTDGIGRDILIRMELLTRLDDYMKKIRATQYDVVTMLRDIAQALVLCDKKNIIHRDIKPDNIMVSESGDFKLVDFGIARNMERTSQASTKAGSYPYMAPEVQMHQPYGKSVDIYSLGVVAYRELNGYRYPFLPPYPQSFTAEDRDMALYRRFRGDKIPPIPGVSRQLFAIIEKCIAHKPEHRYSNAQDLLKDLNAMLASPDLKKKRLFDDAGSLLTPANASDFHPSVLAGGRRGGGSMKEPSSVSSSASGQEPSSRSGRSVKGGSVQSVKGGSVHSVHEPGSSVESPVSFREEPGKKKGGKKFIIILAAVLALAAAGAAVFFVTRKPVDRTIRSVAMLPGSDAPARAPANTVAAKSQELIRVEGVAAPGEHMVLRWGSYTAETDSDGEGGFVFQVDPSQIPVNQTVEMEISYAAGEETDNTETVAVTRDGGCGLEIDEAESGTGRIRGRTDAYATVTVEGSGESTEADDQGSFTLEPLSARGGETVSLRASDVFGNESDPVSWTVPYELTVDCTGKNSDQVILGSTESFSIFGKGPDGQTIQVRASTSDGLLLYDGTIPVRNGEWNVDVSLRELRGEGTLTLAVEWDGDPTRNMAPLSATRNVDYDRYCFLYFYGLSTLSEDTATLQGRTDPNARVSIYRADDTYITSAAADENGDFIIDGVQLTAGDMPYAVAEDKSNNKSDPYPLPLVLAGTKSGTPAAAEEERIPVTMEVAGWNADSIWTLNSLTLTGEAMPGRTLEAWIGNRRIVTFEAEGEGERGTYTAEIPLQDFVSTREQQLEIRVQYADGVGQGSDTAVVTYDAKCRDPEPPAKVIEGASVIRGTADPGDIVFFGSKGEYGIGTYLNSGDTAGEDGAFEIHFDTPLETGDYLLVAQDRAGNWSNMIEVPVLLDVRTQLGMSVYFGGEPVKDGTAINRSGNITVIIITDDEEYEKTILLRGTRSGAEVRRQIGSTDNILAEELGTFEDGETLELTVYYTDLDISRYSASFRLVLDCSTADPVLESGGLTAGMTSVAGTAEPGSTVYMVMGDKTCSAAADPETGAFLITESELSFRVGEQWEIYAVDSAGNESGHVTYEVRDILGISCGESSGITDGVVNGSATELTFTGNGEPGKSIAGTLNGEPIEINTDPAAGTWSLRIDAEALKENENYILQVAYTDDADGAYGYTVSFLYDPACEDVTVPEMPTEDSAEITGYTEKGATVILYATSAGEPIATVTADAADGGFRLPLPEEYRNENQLLYLTATDAAGNPSATQRITVGTSPRTGIEITRNLPEAGGLYLVSKDVNAKGIPLGGKGYSGLAVRLTLTDGATGETVSETEAPCTGGGWSARVSLPESWDTILVRAEYADGKHADTTSDELTLKYDGKCELYILPDKIVDTTEGLIIETESGAEITVELNGTPLPAEPDGEATYRVALPELRPGYFLNVTGTDPAGNTNRLELKVQEEERDAPTVRLDKPGDPVNGQAESLRFSGTAMPERDLILTVGEWTSGIFRTDADGNWNQDVSAALLNMKDGRISYKVRYADRGEETGTSGSFTYDSGVALQLLDAEQLDEDTESISGTTDIGAKVTLEVHGTKETVTSADGSFRFSLSGLNAGDELAVTAEDAAGNTAEAKAAVKAAVREDIVLTGPELINGRVKTGRLSVEGRAQAGKRLRITVTDGNGNTLSSPTVENAGGIWRIQDCGVELTDGTEYTVHVAYDDGKSPDSAASMVFTADGTCAPAEGVKEKITDADTAISGTAEPGATVHLMRRGTEIKTATAGADGSFTLRGLTLECDDTLTIYVTDAVGNKSTEITRTVETIKEKLWSDISIRPGSNITSVLMTRGTIYSHEPLEIYYTLTDAEGAIRRYELDAGETGLAEDLAAARETAEKKQPGILDTHSIRYAYELVADQDITLDPDLPNGEYTYRLYVEMTQSGEQRLIHEETLQLADPEKEEKAEEKDNVNGYTDPLFIAGLDDPVQEVFPRSEILITGWIWAGEGVFSDPQFELEFPQSKFGNVISSQEINGKGGRCEVVYRNVIAEGNGSGQYGTPDPEKAGFVIWIPLAGDLDFTEFAGMKMDATNGEYDIVVYIKNGPTKKKIGTLHVTIKDSGPALNGADLAESIVTRWDDRPGE